MLLMPVLHGLFNFLMRSRGYDYIANGLIQKFLISPQGLIMALVSLAAGFIIILLEIGGLIILSHQAITGAKESRFIDILKYSLSKSKYLLGFDGIVITLYLLLIAPLLDNNAKASVFKHLRIPGFIMDVIEANNFYFALLSIVVIIVTIFSIRWIFALHVLLLNKNGNKNFLKESAQLVKGNFMRIIKHFIALGIIQLFYAVMQIMIGILISLLILFIFSSLNMELVVLFLFCVAILGILLLSFVGLPLSLIYFTKIYHSISTNEIKPLEIKEVKRRYFFDTIVNSKITWGISIILILICIFLYSVSIMDSFENVKYDVAITAHRGSSKEAPENTKAALMMAMKNGADYAEIDVQLTQDGHVILLHDKTLARTGSTNKLTSEISLEEIRKLDVGKWFSKAYVNEPVPTLQEVLELTKGKIKLNIEIKGYGNSLQLIPKVIDLIHEYDFMNECVITSLDYNDLLIVEETEPKLKTGYIMFVALGNLEKMEIDFYSVEESNVSEDFVEKAHKIGREVHVWTINSEESMQSMLELGVDNIITDYDRDLYELILKLNK